jgi:hypothetical protein
MFSRFSNNADNQKYNFHCNFCGFYTRMCNFLFSFSDMLRLHIFLMALQPLWALAAFQFPDLFTISKTPWRSDQLLARPLPKHRTAQTQNKRIHTPNIHVDYGIRNHDHSVHALDRSATVTGTPTEVNTSVIKYGGGTWSFIIRKEHSL